MINQVSVTMAAILNMAAILDFRIPCLLEFKKDMSDRAFRCTFS